MADCLCFLTGIRELYASVIISVKLSIRIMKKNAIPGYRKAVPLVFLFATIPILWNSIPAQNTAEVLNIGSRLELFVDDFLIEKMEGVRRMLHAPQDAGPVLFFDRPWEGPFCGYSTIILDSGLYRLYYRGLPRAGQDGSSMETTCYAESRDGIHWTRPELGLYEKAGTWKNNIILADAAPVTHNFSPFLDAREGIRPGQRYKALGGTKNSGLIAFVSADGIQWHRLRIEPVITEGYFDSQNVSFWSAEERSYLCYFRTWKKVGGENVRTISRTTSRDFIHWSDPVEMDFGDTPAEHLYTNQTAPYFRAPHIYVAIAARFMPGRQVLTEEQALRLKVNPAYFNDCSDAVLMTSRGGTGYQRDFMEGFIRPGIGLQNWVSRSNYPALNVVRTGPHEMSVFVNQDYAQPTSHLQRYTLRLDGFVSVQASYEGGRMTTRPIRFSGDTLFLNFSTSAAGSISVGILDLQGNSIEGYELENATELIGNETEKAVSWPGGSDLSDLAGKPVRLRFNMKDADLYSLRFK
jgi:hypothetical protein